MELIESEIRTVLQNHNNISASIRSEEVRIDTMSKEIRSLDGVLGAPDVGDLERQRMQNPLSYQSTLIAMVAPQVTEDVTVLDATGKYLMPGGIDPHTHLGMEFMGTETIYDFFSGQAAALAWGTTMHIYFIIPVNGSMKKCKSLGAIAMVHAENGDGVVEGQKRMIELGIRGPEGHALSRPSLVAGDENGITAFQMDIKIGRLVGWPSH